MKVNVTGYRNWVNMAFPVLEESALVVYQSEQSSMKRVVSAPGKVNPSRGRGVVDRLGVNDKSEDDGQYFEMSFLRFDSFTALMEPDDWKGREAGFELASQSLPPLLTLYFPVGTLL